MSLEDLNNADRIGIVSPVFVEAEVEQNSRTGSQTTRRIRGTLFECDSWKDAEINSGASQVFLRSVGTGDWEAQSVYPFNQFGFENIAPRIHELEVGEAILNVYQNPKLRTIFSDTEISIIARIVRDWEGGQYPKTEGGIASDDAEDDVFKQMFQESGSEDLGNLALAFFRTVAYRKTDSYLDFANVYRVTLTAATPQQIQASYDGKGKIWTSDEVMNAEGLDPNGFFALDRDMQWLKSPPQVLACAGQKTQVIYTYKEFKQASGFLYEAYGAARLLDFP